MPRFSCSRPARSRISRFACSTAWTSPRLTASRFAPESRRRQRARPTSSAAIREAISPAAWPPIPSATRKTPWALSRNEASSFIDRTRPMSVRAALIHFKEKSRNGWR